MRKFLYVILFLLIYSITNAQVKSYQYPSGQLNEMLIDEIIQQSKSNGTRDNELVVLRKGLHKRLQEQAAARTISQPEQVMASCSNLDFELGNYSSWTLNNGNINGVNLPCDACAATAGGIATITTATNSGTTWTNGIDNCLGLPVVAPGGGLYSVCLNDNSAGGKMQKLKQTFLVSASNTIFTFQFLAVVQDGLHPPNDQPYFTFEILDSVGNVIPSTYNTVSAGATTSGLQTTSNCDGGIGGLNYLGWRSVLLDLSAYVGHNVTVQYIVSDCNQGGHYGYAYIDGACGVMAIDAPKTNICSGDTSITLNAPYGAGTYSWTGPGIVGTTNTYSVQVNLPGTYSVTISNLSGSSSYSTTLTQTVSNVGVLPTISISGNTSVCIGNNTILTASGANSYTWTASGSSINAPTITAYGYSNTTYTVSGVDINGCVGTNTVSVTVNSSPTIAIAGSTSICPGINDTLIASGALTYTWSANAGSALTALVIVAPTSTKTYTVTGKDINQCLNTKTITVSTLPAPTVSAPSSILCAGHTATITASGATSYTWNTGTTGSSIVVTPSVTTTYTVAGSNGSGCSKTVTSTITIAPNPTISFLSVASSTAQVVCSGTGVAGIGFSAPNATYISWSNSNTAIGVPASGTTTGINPYTAPIVTVPTTGVITVFAYVTSTSCSSNATYTITINPKPTIIISAFKDTICVGSVDTLTAHGANTYTWSTGQNATSIAVNPIQNQTYTLTGMDSNTCVNSSTFLIHASRPHSYFTLKDFNPELGDTIYTVNNSINPLGTYAWDFGTGSVPRYSNSLNISNLTYTNTGVGYVKLVSTNYRGCKDSLTQNINIINPVAPDSFPFAQGYSSLTSSSYLSCLKNDNEDNLFLFCQADNSTKTKIYSNHSDSINTNSSGVYQLLVKFNKKGIPQWSTTINQWATGQNIEVDSLGNVYCSYQVSGQTSTADSLVIHSTDSSHVSLYTTGFNMVVKYSKDGVLQWYCKSTVIACKYLKADKFGNMYVSWGGGLAKINSSGNIVWITPIGYSNGGDIAFDSHGNIWMANYYGLAVQKYDTSGNLLFTIPALMALPSSSLSSGIFAQHIRLDKNDNLYLAGVFDGKFKYGTDTISYIFPGGVIAENIFLCKMKPNGQQLWIKQIQSANPIYAKGIDVKDDKVGLLGEANGDTVSISKTGLYLPYSNAGTFVFLTDTLGNNQKLLKLYETNNASLVNATTLPNKMFNFNKKSNSINFAFEFNTPFPFHSKTVIPYLPFNIGTSGTDYFVGVADIDSLTAQTLNSPVSAFSPTGLFCTGNTISLTDSSTHSPTSWTWSAVGGIPASSTQQNPQINYSSAGVYTVSLTTSNIYGQGSVSTQTIAINPLPAISITSSVDTLCIGSAATLTAIGAINYLWDLNTGGAVTNTVAINPLITTSYSVTGTTQQGCSNKDSILITVINCTTGIDQLETNNDYINIYPNPNNGSFAIETSSIFLVGKGVLMQIYDVNGKLVLSQIIHEKTNIATTLSDGVYNISLTNNEKTINKKLVIVK